MTYKLRDYQEDAVKTAISFLESGGNKGVLHLPCGAGKSWIYAEIAKRMNKRTIILQPNKDLCEQNFDKMCKVGLESESGIMCAGLNRKQKDKFFTFATPKTLISQLEHFQDVGLILDDECDTTPPLPKKTMGKIQPKIPQKRLVFDFFKKAGILGGTATPYRLNYFSGYDGVNYTDLRLIHMQHRGFWKDVIFTLPPQYLIDQGYLTKTTYKDWSKGFSENELKVTTNNSNYTEKSVEEYLTKEEQIERQVKAIKYLAEKRSFILVFTSSVNVSHLIKNELKKIGLESEVVSSHKKDAFKRSSILKSFKDGDVRIVLNTNILTAGLDFPELDCVLFTKPTLSLRTIIQAKGRGDRIAKGKKDFWFVDLCNNLKRFGTPEEIYIKFKNKVIERTSPSGQISFQKKNYDELWNLTERLDNKVLSSFSMM